MLVVVALGGNALLRRGEPADVTTQRANLATAVEAIAELAAEHDVVITHGNGPLVGLLALQGEAHAGAKLYPLDVLGAESEGMVEDFLVRRRLGGINFRSLSARQVEGFLFLEQALTEELSLRSVSG